LDDIEKIKRLEKWCEDLNNIQRDVEYKYLYIKQEDYEKEKFNNFSDLIKYFNK